MNPLRQLWELIVNDDDTPALKQSREVEVESYLRQQISKRIIRNAEPPELTGPLQRYIWGEGRYPDD